MALNLRFLTDGHAGRFFHSKYVMVKGGTQFELVQRGGAFASLEHSDGEQPVEAFIWSGPFPIAVDGELFDLCADVVADAHDFLQRFDSPENYVQLHGERTLLLFQSVRGAMTARKTYILSDDLLDRKRWAEQIINDILVSSTNAGRKVGPATVPVAVPFPASPIDTYQPL